MTWRRSETDYWVLDSICRVCDGCHMDKVALMFVVRTQVWIQLTSSGLFSKWVVTYFSIGLKWHFDQKIISLFPLHFKSVFA